MWSSLVGGFLGSCIGGIPGALVGAALGAQVGKHHSADNELGGVLHYLEDDVGVLCIFYTSLPQGVRLIVRASDSKDRCRKGLIKQYQDSDGDFVINTRNQGQAVCFYIPYSIF